MTINRDRRLTRRFYWTGSSTPATAMARSSAMSGWCRLGDAAGRRGLPQNLPLPRPSLRPPDADEFAEPNGEDLKRLTNKLKHVPHRVEHALACSSRFFILPQLGSLSSTSIQKYPVTPGGQNLFRFEAVRRLVPTRTRFYLTGLCRTAKVSRSTSRLESAQ